MHVVYILGRRPMLPRTLRILLRFDRVCSQRFRALRGRPNSKLRRLETVRSSHPDVRRRRRRHRLRLHVQNSVRGMDIPDGSIERITGTLGTPGTVHAPDRPEASDTYRRFTGRF